VPINTHSLTPDPQRLGSEDEEEEDDEDEMDIDTLVHDTPSAGRAKRNRASKSKGKATAYKSTEIVDLSDDENMVGPGYATPPRRQRSGSESDSSPVFPSPSDGSDLMGWMEDCTVRQPAELAGRAYASLTRQEAKGVHRLFFKERDDWKDSGHEGEHLHSRVLSSPAPSPPRRSSSVNRSIERACANEDSQDGAADLSGEGDNDDDYMVSGGNGGGEGGDDEDEE
jgi:hypothetical protein